MAPHSPSDTALIELTTVLGATGARAVARDFLRVFPTMLHELARGDRDRGCRAAHGLKSSARQVGALALSEHMSRLEARLGRPDGKVTAADIADVSALFSEAAGPLRAFIKTGK